MNRPPKAPALKSHGRVGPAGTAGKTPGALEPKCVFGCTSIVKKVPKFHRPIAIGERSGHVPASHVTLVSAPSRYDRVHGLCETRSSISHTNYNNTVFDEGIALSSVDGRRPYDKCQRADKEQR